MTASYIGLLHVEELSEMLH